jgi:uncharacterized delta-60 repeat protein
MGDQALRDRLVAVQGDGKILIGGDFTTVNKKARRNIARLNADGTLDDAFGRDLSGADDWVSSVVVQSDGKIVIGGDFTSVNGLQRGRVARLNADGTIDETFGKNMSGADRLVRSIALQNDGKILISGSFISINGILQAKVARLWGLWGGPVDTSPRLELMKGAEIVVLSWPDPSFSLQSAPFLTGMFTNVLGATSPHTNSITGSQQYYRLAK